MSVERPTNERAMMVLRPAMAPDETIVARSHEIKLFLPLLEHSQPDLED